jgi:hypothetical protein
MIKTGAVDDIRKIIDLSQNIPNALKPALKKNAINEIYIEDVRTQMSNGANAEDITNTLESYRGSFIFEANCGLLNNICLSSPLVSFSMALFLMVLINASCPEVSRSRLTISEPTPPTLLLFSKLPLIIRTLPS